MASQQGSIGKYVTQSSSPLLRYTSNGIGQVTPGGEESGRVDVLGVIQIDGLAALGVVEQVSVGSGLLNDGRAPDIALLPGLAAAEALEELGHAGGLAVFGGARGVIEEYRDWGGAESDVGGGLYRRGRLSVIVRTSIVGRRRRRPQTATYPERLVGLAGLAGRVGGGRLALRGVRSGPLKARRLRPSRDASSPLPEGQHLEAVGGEVDWRVVCWSKRGRVGKVRERGEVEEVR